MAIPQKFQGRFAYHFTLLDNLKGAIKHGLLAPNEQKKRNVTHHSIAAAGIQHRRAQMKVTCGPGGVVHDYVPFYFCPRSSMLLSVVNAKNVDQLFLIYYAIPIEIIDREDVVFTDASANTLTPPKFFTDPADLSKIKWDCVDSPKWSLSPEANQARMAEVLVHNRVNMAEVSHIVVWNDEIKRRVIEVFATADEDPPPIVFDGHNQKHHYFTAFYAQSLQSIVTGPVCTKLEFEDCVKYIAATGQDAERARFKNPAALLAALREDFGCLPETAELIGLESGNEVHAEDAGTHTLSVVRELVESAEFEALNPADKRLVELAAFLHDIGKGPKSRWASKGGKQQVDPDHPIGSIKMLRRILTKEVATIKPRSIRVLSKLLCYHDLVGDILGKHRDPRQLEEIAGSERELDMLIALGLADMKAINPVWIDRHQHEVPALRARVVAALNAAVVEDEE